MVPACGPSSELLNCVVTCFDAPAEPIVLREPADIPENLSTLNVRCERNVSLQRVNLFPAPPLRKNDKCERRLLLLLVTPSISTYNMTGNRLPSSLSVLYERLLHTLREPARHQERLAQPLEPVYHRAGEELPVKKQK